MNLRKMVQRLFGLDVVKNGDHEKDHEALRDHLTQHPASVARWEKACEANDAAHATLCEKLDRIEKAVLPNGDVDTDPPRPWEH